LSSGESSAAAGQFESTLNPPKAGALQHGVMSPEQRKRILQGHAVTKAELSLQKTIEERLSTLQKKYEADRHEGDLEKIRIKSHSPK